LKNSHKKEEGGEKRTSWITAVAALHNTDLLASGNYLFDCFTLSLILFKNRKKNVVYD
jgi:hypothetical protein